MKEEGQGLAAHMGTGAACASLSQGRKNKSQTFLRLSLFLAVSAFWMSLADVEDSKISLLVDTSRGVCEKIPNFLLSEVKQ